MHGAAAVMHNSMCILHSRLLVFLALRQHCAWGMLGSSRPTGVYVGRGMSGLSCGVWLPLQPF